LRALPIGVANAEWPHGDQRTLRRVQADPPVKTRLFDVSFNLATNPGNRGYCLAQTGLELSPQLPFEQYLRALAGSYFCIAPVGTGIDTHRTWEALAVGTIPVVTRSLVSDTHADLPLIVLEDWSEFRSVDFTSELYARTWRGWSPSELRLERYLERVRATIDAVRR
jgi:hypothetical protein